MVQDYALRPEVIQEIDAAVERARKLLRLSAGATPLEIVEEIYRFVHRQLQAPQSPQVTELEDCAIDLGCLWGQAVCDAAKWEWRDVRQEGEAEGIFSIVSPDRSSYITPMPYLLEQLTQPRALFENTILLLFNIVRANVPTGSQPGGYRLLS